jgi:hypothetical protein
MGVGRFATPAYHGLFALIEALAGTRIKGGPPPFVPKGILAI